MTAAWTDTASHGDRRPPRRGTDAACRDPGDEPTTAADHIEVAE